MPLAAVQNLLVIAAVARILACPSFVARLRAGPRPVDAPVLAGTAAT